MPTVLDPSAEAVPEEGERRGQVEPPLRRLGRPAQGLHGRRLELSSESEDGPPHPSPGAGVATG